MFKYILPALTLSVFSLFGHADDKLPAGHKLIQNEQGEYLVENKDGVVMIDPAILAIGHKGQWIVACVKNDSIDTDPKRYYFINLKIGGTTDTINQENWAYFQTAYDGLADVTLAPLMDETCP